MWPPNLRMISGDSMHKMKDAQVPILRSTAVLRREHFGGLLLNYLYPPEIKLDPIRFRIALMCDGAFTLQDIKGHLEQELNHSAEYIDLLVKSTLIEFDEHLLLYWRDETLGEPHNFGSFSEEHTSEQRHLSAPLAVIWEITKSCNLRCKHCLSSSGRSETGELTTEEVKEAIDLFADKKIFYINFTGGEPLLRTDIFELLNYASSRKISVDLSTNGILLDEKMVELLHGTNVFQVQISIDGINGSHDHFRGVDGSFQQALKAIKLLNEAEIGVTVSTTVTKYNMDQISKIIDLAMEVGASVFKTTLFIPVGRGKSSQRELGLESNDVHRLALLMKEKEEVVKGRLLLENSSCYQWLLEDNCLPAPSWIRSSTVGCAAGDSNIFVTADGTVTPCPFLRSMSMGNLRQDSFEDIWKSNVLSPFRTLRPGDLKGKCGRCEHLGIKCYGGCRAAALAYNGDLYGEDPFCWK